MRVLVALITRRKRVADFLVGGALKLPLPLRPGIAPCGRRQGVGGRGLDSRHIYIYMYSQLNVMYLLSLA